MKTENRSANPLVTVLSPSHFEAPAYASESEKTRIRPRSDTFLKVEEVIHTLTGTRTAILSIMSVVVAVLLVNGILISLVMQIQLTLLLMLPVLVLRALPLLQLLQLLRVLQLLRIMLLMLG